MNDAAPAVAVPTKPRSEADPVPQPNRANRAATLRPLRAKAWRDAAWPLIGSSVLLYTFAVIAVSLVNLVDVGSILNLLPPFLTRSIEKVAGLPLAQLTGPAGQFSGIYVDMLTIFTCLAWGVLRGSDCVAGEWGRGTLEMLLAQPVRRGDWIRIHAGVTCIGAAIITGSLLLGTWTGLAISHGWTKAAPQWFIPAALNLFCFVLAMSGLSLLYSLFDRERWRVIGVSVGFFSFSLLVKLLARLIDGAGWLLYCTLLGALEPQRLIILHEDAWRLSVAYDCTLLTVAVVCYGIVLARFERQDVPAPL